MTINATLIAQMIVFLILITVNFIVDLIYARLDPRITAEG